MWKSYGSKYNFKFVTSSIIDTITSKEWYFNCSPNLILGWENHFLEVFKQLNCIIYLTNHSKSLYHDHSVKRIYWISPEPPLHCTYLLQNCDKNFVIWILPLLFMHSILQIIVLLGGNLFHFKVPMYISSMFAGVTGTIPGPVYNKSFKRFAGLYWKYND